MVKKNTQKYSKTSLKNKNGTIHRSGNFSSGSTREQLQNEIAIGSHNSKHWRDGNDFRGSLNSNSAVPCAGGAVAAARAKWAAGSSGLRLELQQCPSVPSTVTGQLLTLRGKNLPHPEDTCDFITGKTSATTCQNNSFQKHHQEDIWSIKNVY